MFVTLKFSNVDNIILSKNNSRLKFYQLLISKKIILSLKNGKKKQPMLMRFGCFLRGSLLFQTIGKIKLQLYVIKSNIHATVTIL